MTVREMQQQQRREAALHLAEREARVRWGRAGGEGEDIHRRCYPAGSGGNDACAAAAAVMRCPCGGKFGMKRRG